MKWLLMLLSVSALLTNLPSSLHAQNLRPLAVEDALRVRSFFQTPPVFSHDGKWLAYTVTDNGTARQKMERGASRMLPTDIYTSKVDTAATRNLTGGSGSNWLPVWSPDSHFLAFFSTRGGAGRRLWIWDSEKDVLRMVSNVEVRGDQIEWTPNSRSLAVAILPHTPIQEGGDERAVAYEHHADPMPKDSTPTVTVFQSLEGPVSASEPWSLETQRCDLVLVDVTSGKTTSIAKAQRVAKYLLSPDGSVIAYTDPVQFEQPGSQQILFDIATVSLLTKRRQVVALNVRLDYDGAQFSWSPNGRELSFQTGGLLENNHDCYVVDAYLGGSRNVTGLPQHSSSYRTAAPLWNPSGKQLYFIRDGALWQASLDQGKATELAKVPGHRTVQLASKDANELWTSSNGKSTVVVAYDNDQKEDGFYRVDLTSGEVIRLLEKGQCYTCAMRRQHLTASDDGQHFAYFAEDAQHDADLWVSDYSLVNPRRMTHLNPQFDNCKMGSTLLVDWLSDDGEPLRGAVLLPPDYEKGKRYPVVVWVYGGETLSDNLHHFGLAYPGAFNMQLLATRGYVVLLPDAPLGTGRPMLDLAKTVVPGLNKLIEMKIADPDRLGIMGHSYGGYSTLALIAQTRRFRAAVEVDGFANLLGIYGEMDKEGAAFGMALQEHGSAARTPWQSRDRYIENSPIFYFDMVDTPLLVIQGSEDETVAPFLADEVFVDLRRLGKEVEYAKYNGEGHSPLLWRYPNQVDLCNRMISWFERHLKSVARETHPDNR
jgi:dipeptidyl aminopeptidase/acylaminoacyl peptidase